MGHVITDNGNFILDLKFPEPIKNPAKGSNRFENDSWCCRNWSIYRDDL